MKTRAIKNKDVMLKLCREGHELLNITKDRVTGKPCYIFENTDKFRECFDGLIKEKRNNYLTDYEKNFIVELLKSKRDELKKLGVQNTHTIDGIVEKLSVVKENGSALVKLNPDLIMTEENRKKLWEYASKPIVQPVINQLPLDSVYHSQR